MRLAVVVPLTVAAIVGAGGCGSSNSGNASAGGTPSGSSHNDAVISQAQTSEASVAQLRAKLKARLQLHKYAGVDNAYTLPPGQPDVHLGEPGKECSIDDIVVGKDQAEQYSGDDHTLLSPDGNAAVAVDVFQGTPLSDCLQAARDALGW